MTTCPTCGNPAHILERPVLESTDGPVEHVRIQCDHGHCYLLPVDTLERALTRLTTP
jgi:hypothetical protein